MGVSDIVNMFGRAAMAPGRVAGGALDMLMQGVAPVGDAMQRASMSPLGMSVAAGAAGASGGAPAVASMTMMQHEAAAQERDLHIQRQLQQELEQTFNGRPFDPSNRESMYSFLQVFGKYYPDKLPDAAAKIGKLYEQHALKAVSGPGGSVHAFDPMAGTAREVVPGSESELWSTPTTDKTGRTMQYHKVTGEPRELQGAQYPAYSPAETHQRPRDLTAIRGIYEDDKKIQAYTEIKRNYETLSQVMQNFETALATGQRPNPETLITGITTFTRMIDPGLGVRESDILNVKDAQALMDRFKASIEKVRTGGANTQLIRDIHEQAIAVVQAAAKGIQPRFDAHKKRSAYWESQTGIPAEEFYGGFDDPHLDAQQYDPRNLREAPSGYKPTGKLLPNGKPEMVPIQ